MAGYDRLFCSNVMLNVTIVTMQEAQATSRTTTHHDIDPQIILLLRSRPC